MGYELLSKLYYKDRQLFEQEYAQRKHGAFSTSLGIEIHDAEAFYVNTPALTLAFSRLYKKLSTLNALCAKLPRVAYESYERNCLIDEIILSNDIEGVRSTRKEILNVLDGDKESPKQKRFDGMVWKYVLLLDDEHPYSVSLENSRDIRALYDDIVSAEIARVNLPDGQIFRKELAEVISGTQQVKHRGVLPEAKIIEYMDKSLQLLKREDIPQLCKIAILHYMIGYIHPFYDGNGRLSRFISSYLLKQEFNPLVALRLSYAIKDRKSEYYKAFDIANDPHNKGDLTHFILYFAQVVEQAEDSLIERLQQGKEILFAYRDRLLLKYPDTDPIKAHKTLDVLWYLIQNELFSHEHMDRKVLADLLKTSKTTAHSYILHLIDEGAPISIEQEGHRSVYRLDQAALLDFLQPAESADHSGHPH